MIRNQLKKYGQNGLLGLIEILSIPFCVLLVIYLYMHIQGYLSLPFVFILIALGLVSLERFFGKISPKSEQIYLHKDYFLIHNRLFFWKAKLQFHLKKVEEVYLYTYFHKIHEQESFFKLKIHLEDGRSFSYKIYDDRWSEVQKYFHSKQVKIYVFH